MMNLYGKGHKLTSANFQQIIATLKFLNQGKEEERKEKEREKRSK
jgi:hypothetical protein